MQTPMIEEIKFILAVVATPTVSVLAILIYLFNKPEKLDQWAALMYKFFSFITQRFGVLKSRVERGLIAADIQAVINTTGQELSRESPGTLPHMVKVEWIKDDNVQSYLKDGKVIVRLNRQVDQARNVVVTTLAYLSKGLLPRSKMYLDDILRQATDFAVAKRMFAASRETGAAQYFFSEIFEPAIKQTPQLYQDAGTLDALQNIGYFSHVYLTELRELGEQLWPATPSERIFSEIRRFVDFLHVIAKKERNEDVPLQFQGARLKAAILLVARPIILQEIGIRAYERRVAWLIRNGFNSIYINGWGEPNIFSVRALLSRCEQNGQLTVLHTYTFSLALHRGERLRNLSME
jgi:hypothetical protein